ncbi:hypothetical protein BIW12_12385 [Flavobacterium commune]|uniref:Uncharacterized protein n=1 Tax=Flavobacterium commune TaxID=1306519 RepID=A0A1D9PC42_9FLAO|nr:hypothetical protein BIW12_12385 [Flavobacterium commune]
MCHNYCFFLFLIIKIITIGKTVIATIKIISTVANDSIIFYLLLMFPNFRSDWYWNTKLPTSTEL